MTTTQLFTDKAAISLSLLCAVHCLLLPVAVIAIPSIALMPFGNEAFHTWMVALVAPTSLFALTMGCKKHKRYQLFIFGIIGLSFLFLAITLGENTLGEFWEKAMTVIGAALIAVGHYRNYRLCQKLDDCGCHDIDNRTLLD